MGGWGRKSKLVATLYTPAILSYIHIYTVLTYKDAEHPANRIHEQWKLANLTAR